MLVPGTLWKQYHIEVGKLMTSELLGRPSIKPVQNENPDWPAYKKIFHARNLTPHGTRYPRTAYLKTYKSRQLSLVSW
jgi:hypothetical protein